MLQPTNRNENPTSNRKSKLTYSSSSASDNPKTRENIVNEESSRSINDNNSFSFNTEESHVKCLDKGSDEVTCRREKSVEKVADSENHESSVFVVIDAEFAGIGGGKCEEQADEDQGTITQVPKEKDATSLETAQNKMNDNIENNLNNNTIDYIEMLTLDAREFIKCNCDKNEKSHFCKDCYVNIQNLPNQETNDNDFIIGIKESCESITDNNDEKIANDAEPKPVVLDRCLETSGEQFDKNCIKMHAKNELLLMADSFLSLKLLAQKLKDQPQNADDYKRFLDLLSNLKENTNDNLSMLIQQDVNTIKSSTPIDWSTKKNIGNQPSEGKEEDASLPSSEVNLDPITTLAQHLVSNPPDPFPNVGHPERESCASSLLKRRSIDGSDVQQEQASLSSRESDVGVVRVSQTARSAPADSSTSTGNSIDSCGTGQRSLPDRCGIASTDSRKQLTWIFNENGRLVFIENQCEEVNTAESKEEEVNSHERPPVSLLSSCSSTDGRVTTSLLSSKSINRRSEDTRIKYLEGKLKQAGISDLIGENNRDAADTVKTSISDHSSQLTDLKLDGSFVKSHSYTVDSEEPQLNLNPKFVDYSEFQSKQATECPDNSLSDDFILDESHGFCQFDVTGFSTFSVGQPDLALYNEYIEDSSSSDSCDCGEEDHFIVIRRTNGDGAMVNDTSDRSKHNPDRDNLKSLLKKPGKSRDKKSNRVIFNENKNEFFDADYIILIREDCELDEDDDDGICTCQQHEMVRLTCCEPNCNCQYEGAAGEPTPQSPKFAPPMEFVDVVTLSPPEGYKDMEMMAGRLQTRGPVCRECSATHEDELDDEGEASQSDSDMDGQTDVREQEEKEKTDQSQQTTPTTPPSIENSNNQSYILDTLSSTKVTQQYPSRPSSEDSRRSAANQGSPISGILKGGRLWKQQSIEANLAKNLELNTHSSDSVTSDEETTNKRSVRFIETDEKEKRVSCDGAPESTSEEEIRTQNHQDKESNKQDIYGTSPTDAIDITLRFGNHLLIPSENSLKPNSAVRQLFSSCTKSLATPQVIQIPEEEDSQQYLVTSESLKAFEEAKRSKLPQIIQTGDIDEPIKRAIERNTLRRSLIRYEPRNKRQPYKNDNSLVERIKQLTCNVDDNNSANMSNCNMQTEEISEIKPEGTTAHESSIESGETPEDVLDSRASPPGEESRVSPDVNTLSANKSNDKSFSPSSSSSASSSSSMSINQQNYNRIRKLSNASEQVLMLDLKRVDAVPDIQNNFRRDTKPLPDIGGPHNHDISDIPHRVTANPPDLPGHCLVANRMSSSSNTSESRRQFLSSLTPLAACVSMGGVSHNDDYYYHLSNHHPHLNQPGERVSVASSGTEYSLEDIEEGLNKTEEEEQKRIAPDVLAGTPSASESGDELAMFVQQDAGRIERIKKKYLPMEQQQQLQIQLQQQQQQQQQQQGQNQPHKDNKHNDDEDDEHDDYGFNRRPSVRGIKPRFSTTTEILQQIQNQLQPPAPPATRVAWPYYSESDSNAKQKNINQGNYAYINVGEEVIKSRGYPPQYRQQTTPAGHDESLYQNCANQMCVSREMYQRTNANVYVRTNNECYQSLPRQRTGRPHSPPPMDMSRQYHQTMVYIPYNHIDGYQPVQYYQHTTGSSEYVSRVSSQNQINKRYVEPVYQSSRVHHHGEEHHHYNPNVVPPPVPPKMNRVSYPNGQAPPAHHMMAGSRSESPLPGQFSTARSTQTPVPSMSQCGYYPGGNPRYRPVQIWQGEGNYATKVNRHSFPAAIPRYPPADSISLTDSDSQHSGSIPNGYNRPDLSIPNSPTKPRFIERGVPEGAASVSPQDMSGVSQSSNSTMTSPTSPQNPPVTVTNQKPVFYAMNV
ncbi:uncharacterized protein LOC126745652 isoform X2 [Anthonomus grandis grandis]|nr:uncharacterized protein LOC126745652 isoform X2 [Anthonomus grandis grandis]